MNARSIEQKTSTFSTDPIWRSGGGRRSDQSCCYSGVAFSEAAGEGGVDTGGGYFKSVKDQVIELPDQALLPRSRETPTLLI